MLCYQEARNLPSGDDKGAIFDFHVCDELAVKVVESSSGYFREHGERKSHWFEPKYWSKREYIALT